MMMTWDLYAIRYATNPRRKARDNFVIAPADPHDGPMPMDYFVWAAVKDGRAILIDSGADKALCEARGNDFLRCPTEGLNEIGVDATKIESVVTTHLHWDHAGNFGKFPRARFHAQACEIAHATGPCMCKPFMRRAYDVEQVVDFVRLVHGDRVQFHEGEGVVADGITVRHVGGHAAGLQVVRVHTKRGWVVVASDAMHFFANGETGNPFPVLVNVKEYLDGIAMLPSLGEGPDHVVAGHDPRVRAMYPEAAKDVYRLDVMPASGA
jgi:glyoxylase-like metal-dependent hydrolase (beta-lactamase superfamily II)